VKSHKSSQCNETFLVKTLRPGKKFGFQSAAENLQWRRRPDRLRQTVPDRCSSCETSLNIVNFWDLQWRTYEKQTDTPLGHRLRRGAILVSISQTVWQFSIFDYLRQEKCSDLGEYNVFCSFYRSASRTMVYTW